MPSQGMRPRSLHPGRPPTHHEHRPSPHGVRAGTTVGASSISGA
jgi:hypothetical protein